MPAGKPLTWRQRKALGLPKSRPAFVTKRGSAGRIVIPGGRFKRSVSARAGDQGQAKIGEVMDGIEVDDESSVPEEWQRNGTGRLDVRGFRELKI